MFWCIFPFVFVHCNPGLRHVMFPLSIMIDVHWVHGRKEHRMHPFFDVFASWNQRRLNDRVRIVGPYNVADVLSDVAR